LLVELNLSAVLMQVSRFQIEFELAKAYGFRELFA
jgi:hypothetical protein